MEDVKWIIEKYEDSYFLNNLINEVDNKKIDFRIIDKFHFGQVDLSFFNDNDCVVFYGGLSLSNYILKNKKWIPGAFCNSINLECLTYYSYFGKYLLNKDYIMLPLCDFYRRKGEIYNIFSVDGNIFIRPNSGQKTFCGNLFHIDTLSSEMKIIEEYGKLPLDRILIVISSPKKIEKEWRVVVADRKIVTSSLYKQDGFICEKEGCDDGVIDVVSSILSEEWQPENVYVLDICLCDKSYSLLEINSFSCSGLYHCDAKKVIEKISICAKKEWLEYKEV